MNYHKSARVVCLVLAFCSGIAHAQQARPIPDAPPIAPNMHMLPPDINFENRELHAEWRPVAEAAYDANRDFYFALRDLRQAIAAAPAAARENGRVNLPVDDQCRLFDLTQPMWYHFRIANEQQVRLLSIMMRYGSRLSVRDAESLAYEVQTSFIVSNGRTRDLMLITDQLDYRHESTCSSRRMEQERLRSGH